MREGLLGHEGEEITEFELAFVLPVDHLGPLFEFSLGWDLVE